LQRANHRPKQVRQSATCAALFMFAVACFDRGAIRRHHAGVVELVDAPDSKTFNNQKSLANTLIFSHIFRQVI
jgi:hypothetical protein